jgi:hypothetical protein
LIYLVGVLCGNRLGLPPSYPSANPRKRPNGRT